MTSAPVLDRYRRRAIRTTARPRRGRTTSCSFRSVTFHDLFIYTAYPVAISVVGEPVFATSVIRLVAIITRKTGRRQTRGGASFAIRRNVHDRTTENLSSADRLTINYARRKRPPAPSTRKSPGAPTSIFCLQRIAVETAGPRARR